MSSSFDSSFSELAFWGTLTYDKTSTIEEEILSKTVFISSKDTLCAFLISSSTLSKRLIKSSYLPNKSFEYFSDMSDAELSRALTKSCFAAYKSTLKSFTTLTKSSAKTLSTAVFNSSKPCFELLTSINEASNL